MVSDMSEQFFKPGDKVMRVGSHSKNAVIVSDIPTRIPQWGETLCVEDCWRTSIGNLVMFVGFGGPYYFNGLKTGWQASAFRLVDEIRLCVGAVSHETISAKSSRMEAGPVVPRASK